GDTGRKPGGWLGKPWAHRASWPALSSLGGGPGWLRVFLSEALVVASLHSLSRATMVGRATAPQWLAAGGGGPRQASSLTPPGRSLLDGWSGGRNAASPPAQESLSSRLQIASRLKGRAARRCNSRPSRPDTTHSTVCGSTRTC